jgi:uncharacterized protein (DUF427 family)
VRAPQDHALYLEESPKRVRVVFGDETVADSRRAKLLHEAGLLPVYYFPQEDVRMELLEESDHTTHCPFKGDASYWSVRVGERIAENAVWAYPEPIDSCPPITGLVAFYWNKMGYVISRLLNFAALTRSPVNSMISSGRATIFNRSIL